MPAAFPSCLRRLLARRAAVPSLALAAVLLVGAAVVALSAPGGAMARKASVRERAVLAHKAVRRAHHIRKQRKHRKMKTRAFAASLGPLQFGIYPGGAAGTVGPSGQTKPEVASLRLSAVQLLRGDKPFSVHLYESYTSASATQSVPSWLADQIADYTAHGIQVELVLAYRPSASSGDVGGFVSFVRRRVDQLGPNPRVTSLQVTNEANIGGAPNASDGYYPGATDALVKGVIAAHDEALRGGFGQLKIGFNWAYETGKRATSFFSTLGKKGGRSFAGAVDWVGLDAYPGTWGPKLAGGDLASGAETATTDALSLLRSTLLPRAGVGDAPIQFSESGYPTGDGRSEADQVTVMRAVVNTIVATRGRYGVSAYRWFDLRDADSANPSFESQYGITHDDYSPKAGFFAYRDLVAANG